MNIEDIAARLFLGEAVARLVEREKHLGRLAQRKLPGLC